MNQTREMKGFTLVELLVAVAITVVIAAVMLMATHGTLSAWHRAQDRLTTDAQAESVLELLERDIQSAIVRRDGATWIACDIFDADISDHGWVSGAFLKPTLTELVADEGEPRIGNARFSRSGAWLRFVMAGAEGPVAVGYQIVRRAVGGDATRAENIRYSLYRKAIDGAAMLERGPAIEHHDADLMRPSATHVLATNVVDFGVWFYGRGAGGEVERIFPGSASETTYRAPSAEPLPLYADVLLRVITEEGATLISAMERGLVSVPPEFAGREGDWWWSAVEANSRVYVRRLQMRGAAW
jgi:prepilin-type N-terminal cleavage/methylation domain-containing protein